MWESWACHRMRLKFPTDICGLHDTIQEMRILILINWSFGLSKFVFRISEYSKHKSTERENWPNNKTFSFIQFCGFCGLILEWKTFRFEIVARCRRAVEICQFESEFSTQNFLLYYAMIVTISCSIWETNATAKLQTIHKTSEITIRRARNLATVICRRNLSIKEIRECRKATENIAKLQLEI